MPQGPGKYDELATLVLERAEAAGVVVIIVGGTKGAGFSVQVTDPRLLGGLSSVLRQVADEIDRSS